MLRNEIVDLKKILQFCIRHFLIGSVVFLSILRNTVKNQQLNFPVKLCDIRKNVKKRNC